MSWNSVKTQLSCRVHTKSTPFDNPIHVSISFLEPNHPVVTMRCPHLSPMDTEPLDAAVDSLNAGFHGYTALPLLIFACQITISHEQAVN